MNLVNEIAQKMLKLQWTISIAESCTGGLLSATLTAIPGASLWFKEGLIVYSPESKSQRLGINLKDILYYGAVSKFVTQQLASRVRISSESTIGLGITGNAGPDITEKSNLGDVYISLSSFDEDLCSYYSFPGSRLVIQDKAVRTALDMIYNYLNERQAAV